MIQYKTSALGTNGTPVPDASGTGMIEVAAPSGALAVAGGSAEAVRELKRLLRFCGERPGGAVCCQRMEGAADARSAIRVEIRARLRLLQPNMKVTNTGA